MNTTTQADMKSQIKFGFRANNAKRGKIITGMTVEEYLTNVIGSEAHVITPNGGWFRVANKTTEYSITIY